LTAVNELARAREALLQGYQLRKFTDLTVQNGQASSA